MVGCKECKARALSSIFSLNHSFFLLSLLAAYNNNTYKTLAAPTQQYIATIQRARSAPKGRMTKGMTTMDEWDDADQTHPTWLLNMLAKPDEYRLIMNASDLVLGMVDKVTIITGCLPYNTTPHNSLGKTALTPDHMFTAFLRHNLIKDIVCLFHPDTKSVLNAYHLGTDTCGHPGIIHGGLTSSVIDESFGILVYMLKCNGSIDKGPAFTANLQVDFRAVSCVVCCMYVHLLYVLHEFSPHHSQFQQAYKCCAAAGWRA